MPPAPKISPLRWAGAAALLAAILLGILAVAHRVPWRGKTRQLWSEKDLPALPAEPENGWILLHSASQKLVDDERPGDLGEVERLDWPRVKALAHEIRQFTSDPTVRSQAASARDALASPYFADACPLDVRSRCQHLKLERLHDIVTLAVLADALSGKWDEALLTAATLLRADLEMMRTSRTAVSALGARRMVRKDLRCLGVLFDGIESEGPKGAANHRARVALIASMLETKTQPDAAPSRAVIAEYVCVTRAIRTVSDVAGFKVGADWVMLPYLDGEHAIALANTYFEALMRFAESPSTRAPPGLRRYSRERLGWWAYDAGGKMLLDAVLVDLAPALRDIEEQSAHIAAASTALRNRARAMAK